MKKIKSLIALLLCSVSVFATACGKSNNEGSGNDTSTPETQSKQPLGEDTGEYILQGGSTDYKIVIDGTPTENIQFASNELQYFFKDATGVTIPIVSADGLSYTDTVKYICVGDNEFLESAGIEIDKATLKLSGLRIVTKGNSIFLFGGSDYGSIYSVYAWLNDVVNYEFYYDNIWEIDKEVKDIPLRDYDYTSIPDFDIRTPQTGTFKNKTLASRYNLMRLTDTDILLHGAVSQSSDGQIRKYYLPDEEYNIPANADWYSGDQICFTAHGNPASYEALVDAMVEVMCDSLQEDLTGFRFILGGADNSTSCTCPTCTEATNYYGSNAGAFIKFSNDIRVKLDAWLATEEGAPYNRDYLTIEPLVYLNYDSPPVKTDERGNKYATIQCVPGVKPFYAPLPMDWTTSIYDPKNDLYFQKTQEWGLVSEALSCWYYGTNFDYYLMPFNTFETMQEMLQLTKSIGGDMMMIQGQGNTRGMTSGWAMMKFWLYSKMMWDVDCDMESLIDDWCRVVYADASNIMSDFFDEVRINMYAMNQKGYDGKRIIYRDPRKPEYFSKALLLRWINTCDEALALLQHRNVDETRQAMICAEKAGCLWLLVEIYGDSGPKEEKLMYVDEFFEMCTIAKISNWNHHEGVGKLKETYYK